MENFNQDKYKELGKIAVVSILIGLSGFTLATLLLIFYPLLFMESSIKNGILPTIITMFVSSLIVGILTSILAGLSLFFVYAPMVLIFHFAVMNKKGYMITFLLMFLVLLISFTSLQLGIRPIESLDLEELADEVVSMQIENIDESLSDLEVSRLEKDLRDIYDYSIKIIPGIYIILLALTVYTNYLMAGRRLLLKGIIINQPPIFSNFQLPKITVIVLGLAVAALIVMKNMDLEYYKEIYLNVLLVFGFLFLVDGIALASNLLLRFRVPHFIKILIHVSQVLLPPLAAATLLVGLLDTIVNIRRIRIKRE